MKIKTESLLFIIHCWIVNAFYGACAYVRRKVKMFINNTVYSSRKRIYAIALIVEDDMIKRGFYKRLVPTTSKFEVVEC